MKKLVMKFVLMLVVALSIGAICTACDPEDVDAFAEGYRQGYYGDY